MRIFERNRAKTHAAARWRRTLGKTLVGALSGAAVVSGAIVAFAYGWLNFHALPRMSAIIVSLGFVAFIYTAEKLGRVIAMLGDLRSAAAQHSVAADRAKPRSD